MKWRNKDRTMKSNEMEEEGQENENKEEEIEKR
jgi:hypothetical protein